MDDPSRFKIARCGRRAGKSFADAVYLILECLRAPKMPCLYLGLTRDSAKEIIWPILTMILEELHIPHLPVESALSIKFPNGSTIRIMGADMKNMKSRIRGRKHRLIIIDEMGFFSDADSLIESLIPSLSDYAGTICMTSSPGEMLAGLFYEADAGDKQEQWAHYSWTMNENPYFMKPSANPKFKTRADEEFDLILRTFFKNDRTSPGFRREYLGEWVKDLTSLIYPFTDANLLSAPYTMEEQEHGIGVNLESGSANAIQVVRFGRYSREVQFIESWTLEGATIDQLAEKLTELIGRYHPLYIVASTGDYTKAIVDEMTQRYPDIAMRAAEKKDKTFHQRIMRSDILAGNVKAVKSLPILKEWNTLTRNANDDEILGPPNVLSDAGLYIYRMVYQTYLKSYAPKKTEEERMLEGLVASAIQEKQDYEDDQLY